MAFELKHVDISDDDYDETASLLHVSHEAQTSSPPHEHEPLLDDAILVDLAEVMSESPKSTSSGQNTDIRDNEIHHADLGLDLSSLIPASPQPPENDISASRHSKKYQPASSHTTFVASMICALVALMIFNTYTTGIFHEAHVITKCGTLDEEWILRWQHMSQDFQFSTDTTTLKNQEGSTYFQNIDDQKFFISESQQHAVQQNPALVGEWYSFTICSSDFADGSDAFDVRIESYNTMLRSFVEFRDGHYEVLFRPLYPGIHGIEIRWAWDNNNALRLQTRGKGDLTPTIEEFQQEFIGVVIPGGRFTFDVQHSVSDESHVEEQQYSNNNDDSDVTSELELQIGRIEESISWQNEDIRYMDTLSSVPDNGLITKWKFPVQNVCSAGENAKIKLLVYREAWDDLPRGTYLLVGENMVSFDCSTESIVTIDVPKRQQISAMEGDLIGWSGHGTTYVCADEKQDRIVHQLGPDLPLISRGGGFIVKTSSVGSYLKFEELPSKEDSRFCNISMSVVAAKDAKREVCDFSNSEEVMPYFVPESLRKQIEFSPQNFGGWMRLPTPQCHLDYCIGNLDDLGGKNWVYVPYNCKYKIYSIEESSSCLDGSTVLFWGDSILTGIANEFAFQSFGEPVVSNGYDERKREFEVDVKVDQKQMNIRMVWNANVEVDKNDQGLIVYLKKSYAEKMKRTIQQLESDVNVRGSALVVSSGLHDLYFDEWQTDIKTGEENRDLWEYYRNVLQHSLQVWDEMIGSWNATLIWVDTEATPGNRVWSGVNHWKTDKLNQIAHEIFADKRNMNENWIYISQFDVTFPWHWSSFVSDDLHYFRPKPKYGWVPVTSMISQIHINAMCNSKTIN